MSNKTAMQQLLDQLREERTKLPLPIEWDRCYQAVEMLIQVNYLPLEKEQIVDAVDGFPLDKRHLDGEQYYNETYKKS